MEKYSWKWVGSYFYKFEIKLVPSAGNFNHVVYGPDEQ